MRYLVFSVAAGAMYTDVAIGSPGMILDPILEVVSFYTASVG
jgi:hypothetical protein